MAKFTVTSLSTFKHYLGQNKCKNGNFGTNSICELLGIRQGTLRIKLLDDSSELHQLLVNAGIDPVHLTKKGIPFVALSILVDYFAFRDKYPREAALKLSNTRGVKSYLLTEGPITLTQLEYANPLLDRRYIKVARD